MMIEVREMFIRDLAGKELGKLLLGADGVEWHPIGEEYFNYISMKDFIDFLSMEWDIYLASLRKELED